MYTLLPKLLRRDNPNDADAYKAVEDLNEALTQAEKEGIRNIALTGPYGSGKSSVLKTLMNDFQKDRHYLSISLATLQSDDDLPDTTEDKKEEKREVLNRRIEYSILQQLIYKEKSSTVPSSRFKRIAHFTKKELIHYAFWVVGFVICFFIAFEPPFARIDSMYDIFDWGQTNKWIDLAALIYMLFCFGYIIRYFIQGYSNSKLNKLNLKDGEIDIKEDTSIFNKHLDEIIYFFRATPYNVVIIEDLDRFETPDIYLKLRELNQLINESKEINRHIVFVYAVKDDVFVDEARTKFFDYIITIIPVINSSNSKAILKKELINAGLKDGDISDDDIAGIAFFIQDMRILQNIVHEFTDYKNKLSKSEHHLNLSKLLAMIVYKNYHPKDFALLHKREGAVYRCINHKSEFVGILSENIEHRKKKLQTKRDELQQQNKLVVSELRFLFLNELIKQFSHHHIEEILISNNYRSISSIADNNKFFEELLSYNQVSYTYHGYYNRTETHNERINVTDIYNRSKYKDRIEYLTNEIDTQLRGEIDSINNELLHIADMSITKLVSNDIVRKSDVFKSIELSEIMEVFLIEGYLDEDYYDYISYFYPGMISPSDRDYLMSIKRLTGVDYTHHIDKIENFVKELRPNNFNTENVLNVEVLDFLVANQQKSSLYKDYYTRFCQVIELSGYNISFLSAYYKHSARPEAFFAPYLAKNLTELWNDVCRYENEEQGYLIECILRFGGNLNINILDWIAKNYNYIRIYKEALGGSRIGFFNKTVKYVELDSEDKDLIKLIAKYNAYIINSRNLSILLSVINSDLTITTDSLSFDLIRLCANNTVKDYLLSEDNLKFTFASLPSSVKNESIESIEFILKSSLDSDSKKSYLTGQLVKRDNLKDLKEEEQKLVIECNILKPTWENVDNAFKIFQNQGNQLSDFISKNFVALSIVNSASGIENEVALYDLLFGNNTILSIEEYSALVVAFECECEGNQYLTELNSDRFDILLKNGKIPFDSENLDVLNESEFLSRYLIYHHSSFLNHLEWDYSFTVSVLFSLLQSDKFTQNDKKQILEKAGASLILASSQLASISAGIIADSLPDTKFNIAEIRSIISNSDNLKANIKLVTHLIPSDDLDEDDITQILKSLKDEKFVQLSERHKQPKFDRNPLYYNFLHALKEKHYISSISGNDEVIRPNYHRPK